MMRYFEGDRAEMPDYNTEYLNMAEKYFEKAIELDNNCHRVYANLALIKMKLGKYSEAVGALNSAIELNEKNAKYWAIRAFANELNGNEEFRKSDMYHAIELNPYISERRYFGILLSNTTTPEKYKRYPIVHVYGKEQEIPAVIDILLYIEFSKTSIADFALLTPDTTDTFIKNGWIVISQILPPFVLRAYSKTMLGLVQNGRMALGDPQVTTRYKSQNDRVTRIIHFQLADFVRKVIAHNAIPSYTYFGGYQAGSYLNPHNDRFQCEFTLSLTVQQQPHDRPWPLGLGDAALFTRDPEFRGRDKLEWPAKETQQWAHLYAGDGLLFMGRHLVHFREGTLDEGRWVHQSFLHYVPNDFAGTLD
eukprot:TRINITY_DN2296_c0_g1_i2.p1 TRINITY_DN2296_c0_g1~~TRINITY_DN2296_c0_g1_i2.p1  ORF type:complete len:363 (-),score=87.65 TRINITY_DN2296_c0_g1_i2:134-1222(-)